MSSLNFDATNIAPATERTAWPKAKYPVVIFTSEIKSAKSGKGELIDFGFKSMDGPTIGTVLHQTVTFRHENADAQRIGQSELSAICHATGVLRIADTANLHGHPLIIDVDVEEVKSTDPQTGAITSKTYNRILGYFKADGSPVIAAVGAATPVAASGPPPAWAGAMTPAAPALGLAAQPTMAPAPAVAPAPAATLAPAPLPAPVVAAPAPVPAPAPVVQYYVSHKGVLVTPVPVTLQGVHALGLPPADVLVNVLGESEWKPAASLAAAAPPVAAVPGPPAGEVPPWMRPQQ